MLRRGSAPIAVVAALAAADLATPCAAQVTDLDARWREMFRRPAESAVPADDPVGAARIALGSSLFHDRRLSGRGNRACATCHQPAQAFTDGRRRALGLSGRPLERNTPSLWNLAWGKLYFWDGRASSLEEQIAVPIEAADEMGGRWPQILQRLGADRQTAEAFRRAFPEEGGPTRENVIAALAAYVRSLVSPRTRFDAWIEGDAKALTPSELRGFQLFTGKGGCVLCHVGWRFTDDRFHDIGLRGRGDPGRGAVRGGTPGLAAFKTPGLRDVAFTAPYMHDGSKPSLHAVLTHYAGGFVTRPSLSTNLDRNLRLSKADRADLIAFLRTLSGEWKPARPNRAATAR
jgi:cytochrome c peroxidase